MTTAAGRKQEAYDLLHLINDTDLSKRYAERTGNPVPPFVVYRPQQSGRAYQSAAWQVICPAFKTDPGAHWLDGGHKTFNVYYPVTERKVKLYEALQWATQRFDVTEWKKTNRLRTTGALHPAYVIDWLEAEIKRLREAS